MRNPELSQVTPLLSPEHQKWKSLTKDSILDKKPWFEVFRESICLPAGKVVPEYYSIKMPHYTAVFAVTVDQSWFCAVTVMRLVKLH